MWWLSASSTSPGPHSIPSIYTQCHTLHPQVLIPYHPYTLNVILYIPKSSFHTIHIHSMSYSTSPGPHSIPSIYTQCHTLHPQVLIPYHPYTLNVILYIPRSSFHTIHIHSMSYSTSPGPHSIPSIHTHCHNLHPQVLIPYHPYTLNVILYIPRSSFHTIHIHSMSYSTSPSPHSIPSIYTQCHTLHPQVLIPYHPYTLNVIIYIPRSSFHTIHIHSMSYSTSPSPHSIPSIYTQCHTLHPQVLIPYHPYTLNVILYIPKSSFHTIHIHSMSYSTSPGPHSIPSIYTQCHTLHPQVLIPYHPYTLNVILYIPRSSFHTIHIHSMSYSTSPSPHSIPSIYTQCHTLHPQVLIPYHPYTLNVILYIPRSSFHTIHIHSMSYSTSPSPHSIPSIYTQCHTLHPQVLIPYHPYTLNVILYIPKSSFHTIHIHSMSYSTSPGPHSIPSIYTQCHTLHPQVLIPYHPYTLIVIIYIPRSSFHTIHIHSMSYSTSPGPHSIPSIYTQCHTLHPQVLIPYHPYTLNVILYIPRSSFHTIHIHSMS